MTAHPIRLLHCYGWRGERGPFYLASFDDADQAIAFARTARTHYTRTRADDIRSGEVMYDSDDEQTEPR